MTLTATSVGDLRTGPSGSEPQELVNVEGVLYFTADDGTSGRELWKADPKTGESKMVIDLNPGPDSSNPRELVNFHGRLYFGALSNSVRQLWVYDPARGTTEAVVDKDSGGGARSPEHLTPVGPYLFFTADDGTRGRELWFHRRGNIVKIVKDITPGGTDPENNTPPESLTAVGTSLFFVANEGSGYKLWEVDTVSAGNEPEATIVPATPEPEPPLDDLVDFNGTLYFTAWDTTVAPGRRLWRSDGTQAGTKLAHASAIVWSPPQLGNRSLLVPAGTNLFFPGSYNFNDGAELCVIDATGASFGRDIYPGFRTSIPSYLTRVFGALFFSARDGIFEKPPPDGESATGQELWRSDGTADGTRMVKNVFPGPNDPRFHDSMANSSAPQELTAADGILFFSAMDEDSAANGVADRNLWMSDGSDSGTVRVLGLPNKCNPEKIVLVNTTVFFTATDAGRGRELWQVELPDADRDGLLDAWETSGIDYDMDGTTDLNLPAMGANSRHKDLFLEVDFMKASNHTHDPRLLPNGSVVFNNALERVTRAFADAPVTNPDGQPGINLHAVPDEEIPEVASIKFASRGPDAQDDYQDLKRRFFGLAGEKSATQLGARRQAFRYVILGHKFEEASDSSGAALPDGSDFFVSLGGWEEEARLFSLAFGTTYSDEWFDMVAGTLMHEFGHTLGLRHGGGYGIPPRADNNRNINYKPNYLSVMNYAFQRNRAGDASRLTGVVDGTRVRTGRPLDYSTNELAELREGVLDERLGVGGPAGSRTFYGVTKRRATGGVIGVGTISAADGTIDWDGDGFIAAPTGFVGDVNFVTPHNQPSPGERLLGHNDWPNLVYNFRDSFYFLKGDVPGELPDEEETLTQFHESNFGIVEPDSADLEVTVTASATSVLAGGSVTCTILLTNKGPSAAASVTITDDLPSSTSFVSCTATLDGICGGSGNNRTITFSSLPKGASAGAILTLAVTNSVTPGTVISNTVLVASATADPQSANNSSTLTVVVSEPPARPTIQSVRFVGPRIQVITPATPGYSFRLQYKDTLADPEWHDLPGAPVVDHGIVTLVDDAPSGPTRFYRVVIQPL